MANDLGFFIGQNPYDCRLVALDIAINNASLIFARFLKV